MTKFELDSADAEEDRDIASVMYGVYEPVECSIPSCNVALPTEADSDSCDDSDEPVDGPFWVGLSLLVVLPSAVIVVARLAAWLSG